MLDYVVRNRVRRKLMRKLIDNEVDHPGTFLDLTNKELYKMWPKPVAQRLFLSECRRMCRINGLLEFENDTDLSLRAKATKSGMLYFTENYKERYDRIVGFGIGVVAAVVAGVILRWI